MTKYDDIVDRGVYGCYNENDQLVYVGSTSLSLEGVEYNHRNWKRKKYKRTYFRSSLVKHGINWHFEWLEKPSARNQVEVEMLEEAQILIHKPRFNVDKRPVATSIKRGRYTKEFAEQHWILEA